MSDLVETVDNTATRTPDLFRLGMSLGLANLAHIAIGVTDVAMIGRLGAPELAAATLASSIYLMLSFAGIGFAIGVGPLLSRYLGAGDTASAANALAASAFSLGLAMLPCIAFIAAMEPVLLAVGQDALLSELAGSYAHWLALALPFTFVHGWLWSIASAHGHGRAVLAMSVSAVAVNFVGNYVFIFGAVGIPAFGLPGAGISTALTGLLTALALGLWLWRISVFDGLWRAWRVHLAVWRQIKPVLRYAVPFAVLEAATMAFFAVVAILVGYLGPVPLAAHSIVLQLSEIGIALALGFSEAAAISVAFNDGRDHGAARGRAIRNAVAIGGGGMILFAVAIGLGRNGLVPLFIGADVPLADETIALAAPLMLFGSLLLVVDSGRIVLTGVLQGLDDPRAPAVTSILCFALLGVPAAGLLAFPAGLGVQGIWLGMAFGMGMSSVILTVRVRRKLLLKSG
ncbi:MATE family efflux transporter [Hwanghaeella grinnelliae]|uniref:MATE family efflux transporter n=1 Tax=Hwanghaeella grinnelliae TaxID=2500179 RepID=A0A437QYF8_9PROT|nr:MATE family efflux transporter [Hwanghaeella grinnelliae]RVU39543.1 MATE family efflux transporter [Hwanghaeella grinnelliae]